MLRILGPSRMIQTASRSAEAGRSHRRAPLLGFDIALSHRFNRRENCIIFACDALNREVTASDLLAQANREGGRLLGSAVSGIGCGQSFASMVGRTAYSHVGGGSQYR